MRLRRAGRGYKKAGMTIEIGTKLPDATLYESKAFGDACPLAPEKVSVEAATKGKKVVIFGLPGAFPPTCSAKPVPGYVAQLGASTRCGACRSTTAT